MTFVFIANEAKDVFVVQISKTDANAKMSKKWS